MKQIFLLYLSVITAVAMSNNPQYTATSTHSQASIIEVISQNDLTIFDVASPFGIGKATIESHTGTWSKKVVIRLHLKGLEGFKVFNKNIKLEKEELTVNIYKDYYEVLLPPSLLESSTTEIYIEWVDFYRN